MRTRTKVILAVVAVVVVIAALRIFVVRPFHVAAGSMKPTMLSGDLFLTLAWYSTPQRGDVVTLRYPGGETTSLARIVGLPDERIQMVKGRLHINDKPVNREQLEDYPEVEDGKPLTVKQWSETLPNGVVHRTLDLLENGPLDNTQVFEVPAGHYFMLGDNRDNATDSRIKSRTVPRENLMGRVFFCARSACR